jgi:hypothetical protein
VAVLTAEQMDGYRRDGFVLLEEAFPRSVALRCQDVLWDQLDERRGDPSTWMKPVVRLFSQTGPAFEEAATSRRLVDAVHEVAGPDAAPPPWIGGTFPIRFPVDGDPGDDGWHIDGSYIGPGPGYWINYRSRDRALLMLVLLSDIGVDDAPTRIRVGSHPFIAPALETFGEPGVSGLDFELPAAVHELPLAHATGRAGDVYLCHPFLVHAAQRHHGTQPRFIAQPGVPWRDGVDGFPTD